MIRAALILSAAMFAASTASAETAKASGAYLRGLDKVSGTPVDFKLNVGDTVELGRLRVTLGECRYPSANPAGEAYAFLAIGEDSTADPVFQGWMVASSPALNAMDHRRYDVWVMRCITE